MRTNILSIDGGGYLALSSAAFLAESERNFRRTTKSSFDFFAGTSAGAIISLALASGMPADKVTEAFSTLGQDVFQNKFWLSRTFRTFIRGLFTSRYNNKKLKAALDLIFKDKTFGQIMNEGCYLLIPAFSLTNLYPRIFKTDHKSDHNLDSDLRLSDAALASSAAPLYFPAVSLLNAKTGRTETYIDGGVFGNSPAVYAYVEAIFALKSNPKDIRVLSISTPRNVAPSYESAMTWFARLGLRKGFWALKEILPDILIDGSININHQLLIRLASIHGTPPESVVRVSMEGNKKLGFDKATPSTTEALQNIGMQKAINLRSNLQQFYQGGS